jgi:hypothetical protein
MKLLISHVANRRALKGYSKDHLPVTYRDHKAWMTSTILSQWLSMYALPAWKDYCAKENLDFKILLLVDNAPAYLHNLDDLYDNAKVVFLPSNTTALIQVMDNSVIAALRAYYLRRTFDQLLVATDGEDKPSIREYWRGYNILKAIDNVAKAWEEVTESCMNGVWCKLWLECVQDCQGFKDVVPSVDCGNRNLARKAGFRELESENIEEVLASHVQELANED